MSARKYASSVFWLPLLPTHAFQFEVMTTSITTASKRTRKTGAKPRSGGLECFISCGCASDFTGTELLSDGGASGCSFDFTGTELLSDGGASGCSFDFTDTEPLSGGDASGADSLAREDVAFAGCSDGFTASAIASLLIRYQLPSPIDFSSSAFAVQ